nr:hypothetical protein [Lysinibacillus timonensis]
MIVVEEKYGRREIRTEGLIIDFCRIAPVAIMDEDDRYKTIRIDTNEVVGGAYGTLLSGPNKLVWSERFRLISKILKQVK